MEKKTVLYVVSTLARSGPTNQLHNLIKYLDESKFETHLVTLSPEPEDSLLSLYESLNIKLHGLGLSRVGGVFKAKKRLIDLIEELQPSLIHTQGIRADSLMSKIKVSAPWLMTSRNYPFDDYPMKFGRIKGKLMARSHMSAMSRCGNVIACSKTIAGQLQAHGVNALAIQNGVLIKGTLSTEMKESSKLPAPVFITVGSLISRKNTEFVVEAFNQYAKGNEGSLIVLGDGPEMQRLKDLSRNSNVCFSGNVPNVMQYLKQSNYFISASLSEGLPNTVLEALASGLPVLLSDIPSHIEIAFEATHSCGIFQLDDGAAGLAQKLEEINELFPPEAGSEAVSLARDVFSAQIMSRKYQERYLSLMS